MLEVYLIVVVFLLVAVSGVWFSLRRAGTTPPPARHRAPVRPAHQPYLYVRQPSWANVWLSALEAGATAHGLGRHGSTRCGEMIVRPDGGPLGELLYTGTAMQQYRVAFCVVCFPPHEAIPVTAGPRSAR